MNLYSCRILLQMVYVGAIFETALTSSSPRPLRHLQMKLASASKPVVLGHSGSRGRRKAPILASSTCQWLWSSWSKSLQPYVASPGCAPFLFINPVESPSLLPALPLECIMRPTFCNRCILRRLPECVVVGGLPSGVGSQSVWGGRSGTVSPESTLEAMGDAFADSGRSLPSTLR